MENERSAYIETWSRDHIRSGLTEANRICRRSGIYFCLLKDLQLDNFLDDNTLTYCQNADKFSRLKVRYFSPLLHAW